MEDLQIFNNCNNEQEFFNYKEILIENFYKYNVFSVDTKIFFGNCCRVCNTYLRDYLVSISFIEIMDCIESFMVSNFTNNEFITNKNRFLTNIIKNK